MGSVSRYAERSAGTIAIDVTPIPNEMRSERGICGEKVQQTDKAGTRARVTNETFTENSAKQGKKKGTSFDAYLVSLMEIHPNLRNSVTKNFPRYFRSHECTEISLFPHPSSIL